MDLKLRHTRLPVEQTALRIMFAGMFFVPTSIVPYTTASAACTLRQVASLPADFENNRINVDVAVDGATVKFLLITTSAITEINRKLAQRLNLAIIKDSTQVSGIQGTLSQDTAVVSELDVGKIVTHPHRLTVKDEGGDGTGPEEGGILGQDYLSQFDLEIDPAGHRVNLFDPIQCPEHAAYWADEHFELPLTTTNGLPAVRVSLDGHDFNAYIATFGTSGVDLIAAQKYLQVPASTDVPLPAIGASSSKKTSGTAAIFQELVFGPITIRRPKLSLRRFRLADGMSEGLQKNSVTTDAPVLIGMDILGKFHSFISHSAGKIYFTLANERTAAPAVASRP